MTNVKIQWTSSHHHRSGAIYLVRRGETSNVSMDMPLIFSCKRPTIMGTFPKFLVRTSELMVVLTLKIREM
jgi:hypothetical protein